MNVTKKREHVAQVSIHGIRKMSSDEIERLVNWLNDLAITVEVDQMDLSNRYVARLMKQEMGYLSLDKGSQSGYSKNWGKYRIDLDGYVYTVDGKMLFNLGEDAYKKYRKLSAVKIDRMIERELKSRQRNQ